MTATHITGTPMEDRIAIGTLYLEGYAAIAEHLKTRLDVPESASDCAKFTLDFRALMLEGAPPVQAQVTSGSTPQRDSGVPTSIR